jgi:DNA-binding IclR family transcriptional regulator
MGDVPGPSDNSPVVFRVEPREVAANTGTQSISRAFQVLRCVAKSGASGLRLRDVTAQVALNTSTTHRLLTALVAEGVVVHDPIQRCYRIGADFLSLMDAARDADLTRRYGEVIRFVAAKTGESTYISVPSGTEVLCIARVLGATAIQPIPFDIGGRRPFGIGVAGIIALAAMPEQRINNILAQHEPAFQAYGLTSHDIAPYVWECRRSGFSYNPGLFIKGVCGLGVPINNASGNLIGVLSIVAIASRLESANHRKTIVGLLRSAVNDAENMASDGSRPVKVLS